MMRELKLWRDEETGLISDSRGMIYFMPRKAEGAEMNPQYMIEGGLDMSGSMTLTGNLTVQQSQFVYLRGPITSSGILINGMMTGSGLWIRDRSGGAEHPMEGMGYGIFDRDVFIGGESVKGSIDKIQWFEKSIGRIDDLVRDVKDVDVRMDNLREEWNDTNNNLQLKALKGRIDRLEDELEEAIRLIKEVKGDVDIIMSIIHK